VPGSEPGAPVLPPALREAIRGAIGALEGWCSLGKSERMCEVIIERRCRLVIELGVFGGRSLAPMALTLKHLGSGTAFGIEAYDPAVATAEETDANNDGWWRALDFGAIKRPLLDFVLRHDLALVLKLVELSSDEAFRAFDSPRFRGKVDFLHVDGAHAQAQVMRDVLQWTRLLAPDAVVVLDDIHWPGVQAAQALVKQGFPETIHEFIDLEAEVSYGIYARRSGSE